jgi:hypothetical protein
MRAIKIDDVLAEKIFKIFEPPPLWHFIYSRRPADDSKKFKISEKKIGPLKGGDQIMLNVIYKENDRK